MKIIVIDRKIGSPMPVNPQVEYIPDSALLSGGKPFFIPELPGPWRFRFYPAFRVSRLGKSIAAKFAARYYDALTIAARPMTDNYPLPLITGMDGAFITGRWIALTQSPAVTASIDGGSAAAIDPAATMIDQAIARVSRLMTLKMGDIIAPGYLDGDIPAPQSGTRLRASVNDSEILSFKIK